MTDSQKRQIERLTSDLGIGSRADQGIKHVLGKMPINMSSGRAQQVIDSLSEELNLQTADLCTDDTDDVFGGF